MSGSQQGWLAGAASLPFPVEPGTPLAGYAARQGPATGTLDPLTVGALVLERGGARLAIVAADLAAVDAALVDEVASAAGLVRGELALCASHTHSGPAGVVARLHPAGSDELDPALRACFVATTAEAIQRARGALQPAELLFGQVETAGVAANRNDPALPHDDRVSVLAARRGDGALLAVIVHFACHPTILGAESRVVSADLAGALRRELEALLASPDGSPPVILYLNGAAGDVSTRFTRRGQDAAEVERLGGVLAARAWAALDGARKIEGEPRFGKVTVALWPRTARPVDVVVHSQPPHPHPESPHRHPLRGYPALPCAGEGVLTSRGVAMGDLTPGQAPLSGPGYPRSGWRPGTLWAAAGSAGSSGEQASTTQSSPSAAQRIADTRTQGEEMLAALAALPEGTIATSCDVEAWLLGDLALVGVPAELFASFGQAIAERAQPALVLGYTNGYIGYLADAQAHAAETYEALASPYGPEAGAAVVETASALVHQLRSNRNPASASQ